MTGSAPFEAPYPMQIYAKVPVKWWWNMYVEWDPFQVTRRSLSFFHVFFPYPYHQENALICIYDSMMIWFHTDPYFALYCITKERFIACFHTTPNDFKSNCLEKVSVAAMTLTSSLYLSWSAGSLQYAWCFCVFYCERWYCHDVLKYIIIFLMEMDVICSHCSLHIYTYTLIFKRTIYY